MIRRVLPLLLLVGLALLLADGAVACAVCSGGEDIRSRDSYLNATIFMSLFPLMVIGGGLLWFRRRLRAAAEEHPPA